MSSHKEPAEKPISTENQAASEEMKSAKEEKMMTQMVQATRNDVDSLAEEFRAVEPSSTFMRLLQVFKKNKMGTIFVGRLASHDLVQFSEKLLDYSASYIFAVSPSEFKMADVPLDYVVTGSQHKKGIRVSQSGTFQNTLFGIYLTYVLYNLQPRLYVQPVRLSVPKMDMLCELIQAVLEPMGYVDALYCLYQLVLARAFTAVAFDVDFTYLLPTVLCNIKEEEEGEMTTEMVEEELNSMSLDSNETNSLLNEGDQHIEALKRRRKTLNDHWGCARVVPQP